MTDVSQVIDLIDLANKTTHKQRNVANKTKLMCHIFPPRQQ